LALQEKLLIKGLTCSLFVLIVSSSFQMARMTMSAASHGADERPFLPSDLRAGRIAALWQTVAKLEQGNASANGLILPLAGAGMQAYLPGGGLPGGVLHEVTPANYGDRPAALGFVLALMAEAQGTAAGPAVIVIARRALAGFGIPCGQGLRELGPDTRKLIVIHARTDKDALWALEETLRSQARPALVAGAIEGRLDLTAGRRLNLAAAESGTPLILLRTANTVGSTAAATRWRIASAPAARDRYGGLAESRWRATLERCRNGRPGQWLIEWNHVAHRFRLAESMANRAPIAHAGLRRAS
jgi:protein ImuA